MTTDRPTPSLSSSLSDRARAWLNAYAPAFDDDDVLCTTTEYETAIDALRKIMRLTMKDEGEVFHIAAAAMPPSEEIPYRPEPRMADSQTTEKK